MSDTPSGTNADQVTYWNEVGGPKWVRYQQMLDLQLDGVGALAMDALAPAEGSSVLDVGCGCGATTLALARRVGPTGRAVGLDPSRPMLDLARGRAAEQGLANAEFVVGDAQVHEFRPAFDGLFSRFGVMFFEDPVAAFANLRRALRSDARLAFVCWQGLAANPWMAAPLMAAMQHVSMDAPPSPHAPGPFAFADDARTRGILEQAGFRDVATEARSVELAVAGGADLDSAVDFLLDMGPLARVLAAGDATLRVKVAASVRDAVAPFMGEAGLVMPGATWVVTARA